jgi:hypothetical protein
MSEENRLVPQIWADAAEKSWNLMEEIRQKPLPEQGVAWTWLPLIESEQDREFREQMEENAKHIARVFQISSQMLGVRVVEGSIEVIE